VAPRGALPPDPTRTGLTGAIGPGGPLGPAGPIVDPSVVVNARKIKRAEMRRQLRVAQQLKVATLMVVAMLLLAAYPMYLFTSSVTQDPIFGQLDALVLPKWAAGVHSDAASGSRWCIQQCRFRERTWQSARAPDETHAVYETALRDAGWRPRTTGICPTVGEGLLTCWKHDEYVLDMWVRAPICDLPPPRPTITIKPPAATPSAKSAASAAPVLPLATPETCPGALVTMKVFNAIDYHPVG
jgi:hypothetical protein